MRLLLCQFCLRHCRWSWLRKLHPQAELLRPQAVESLGLSPTAAAAHIAALHQLTASTSDATQSAAVTQGLPNTLAWGTTVHKAAEEELGRFVEQVLLARHSNIVCS